MSIGVEAIASLREIEDSSDEKESERRLPDASVSSSILVVDGGYLANHSGASVSRTLPFLIGAGWRVEVMLRQRKKKRLRAKVLLAYLLAGIHVLENYILQYHSPSHLLIL